MTINEKTPYPKGNAEKVVRDIQRRTRRKFSAEEDCRQPTGLMMIFRG
ncbi:uncharacterized protein METZ01_LOCUS507753 [marine metagenome]|uniref:Uncharacterized protein n=1 Tax=marine metagenome TaxID=408172 RepID=A0A383EE34_9ZZZZ